MCNVRRWRRFCVGCAFVGALWTKTVHAEPFEAFVLVEDEEDLEDLRRRDVIDDTTHASLRALLLHPLDLAHATREELYGLPNLSYADVERLLTHRSTQGPWTSPLDLRAARVLSPAKLRAILPFVRFAGTGAREVSGLVRYRSVAVVSDRRVPPMSLEVRVESGEVQAWTTLGLEREALRKMTFDASRDALVTAGPTLRVWPHRYGFSWRTKRVQLLVGTFSVGFAQRLTVDTTQRTSPRGIHPEWSYSLDANLVGACRATAGERDRAPCADAANEDALGDVSVPSTWGGVAVSLLPWRLPRGTLEAHAWVSLQSPDTSQYALQRGDRCASTSSGVLECEAPVVYQVDPKHPSHPAPALTYRRLPWVRYDLVGGGDLTYALGPRSRVGLRGYGAQTWWRFPEMRLDFRESEPRPRGGPHGALGADGSWGSGPIDVLAEVSYAATSRGGAPRGGFAAIGGLRASWTQHHVELWARYYGPRFENPYAGSVSQPDEQGGLRVRDETGGTLRYAGRILPWWSLRTSLDVWTAIRLPHPRLRFALRQDFVPAAWMRVASTFDVHDRDLRAHGYGHCFEGEPRSDTDLFGDDECHGMAVGATLAIHASPHPAIGITAQYRHRFLDEDDLDGNVLHSPYAQRLRQDGAAALEFRFRVHEAIRLRMRGYWREEKLRSNAFGEHSVVAMLELVARPVHWLHATLGYTARVWLDSRESTASRSPNPEHWLRIRLEARIGRTKGSPRMVPPRRGARPPHTVPRTRIRMR